MGHGNEFFFFIRQQPGINRIGNDPAGFAAFLTDDIFDTGNFHVLQEPPRRIGKGAEQADVEMPISCWSIAFIDKR